MLDLVPNLHVVGLDHSELMVKMASQRLGEHHQVKIQVGNATKLNQVPGHFDRICCANVHQFWKDDKPILQSLYEKLKPNGRLVITYQPRCNNPSNKAADDEGIRLKNKLSEVGFSEIKVLELDLKPVKAISIIARKDSH